MELLIKNAIVYDKDIAGKKLDILIKNGVIAGIGESIKDNCNTIDAKGMLLFPGFIDIHTHLREPGEEGKETIKSGTMAAAHGGYTGVFAMPNTIPPVSNKSQIKYILAVAEKEGIVDVYPVGCITKNQKGKELAEIGDMFGSGAISFSDDGHGIENPAIMMMACKYSKMFDVRLILHEEELLLTDGGQINEGFISTKLGLKGMPGIAEEIMIARDILIAGYTGAKLHFTHVSTAMSIKLIEWGKSMGIDISCDVTPHHLTLTDDLLLGYDARYKMKPPLRTRDDVNYLVNALSSGAIDVIATDHAPHTEFEKSLEFDKCAFGIIGLETAFPVVYTYLVEGKKLGIEKIPLLFSYNPARLFNIKNRGRIEKGYVADITIINPNKELTITRDFFLSKSKNSPYIGKRLRGFTEYTILKGRIIYRDIND